MIRNRVAQKGAEKSSKQREMNGKERLKGNN